MSFLSPIGTRYKAPVLGQLWSSDSKIKKMRQLWVDLATLQKELGVSFITEAGIQEMIENISVIDYDNINRHEALLKHDIMAHIYAFGDICPNARSFIHLGATSNFINDNVDMIIIKESLEFLLLLLENLFQELKKQSNKNIDNCTVAYTHLQPAQLTTVGKRITMWNADLNMDIEQLKNLITCLPFRGVKGTVGTEDTILKLFNGNHTLCEVLNKRLSRKYDFRDNLIICGQTYSRKYDVQVFQMMSSISQTIYKMMNDIRLLCSKNEVYENFGEKQIGSSAMPYKMNPITCEKICSLCRYVMNQENCISQTYINQWLERTLDDSAIKRITYPNCFLLLEHIINESIRCMKTLVINQSKINESVSQHMPFVVSEQIILNGVELGHDRQDIHERLRVLFTGNKGEEDEIISSIKNSKSISIDPLHYVGRSVEQVQLFYDSTS
jgi:adenylosuccinate lyase